ncbi:hypothetical protein VNI00_016421 [Paramarasmius palmivorus]|uniref:Nucleoplasmin-like domain-containing protein n=1 Tax=Paramarasmius palmivorus TaxID=297713 RepID=A0AAW0BEU1_9AGAR
MFWSANLNPGVTFKVRVADHRLRLSNAAITDDAHPFMPTRVVLYSSFKPEDKIALCTLSSAGQMMYAMEVVLDKNVEYVLKAEGPKLVACFILLDWDETELLYMVASYPLSDGTMIMPHLNDGIGVEPTKAESNTARIENRGDSSEVGACTERAIIANSNFHVDVAGGSGGRAPRATTSDTTHENNGDNHDTFAAPMGGVMSPFTFRARPSGAGVGATAPTNLSDRASEAQAGPSGAQAGPSGAQAGPSDLHERHRIVRNKQNGARKRGRHDQEEGGADADYESDSDFRDAKRRRG